MPATVYDIQTQRSPLRAPKSKSVKPFPVDLVLDEITDAESERNNSRGEWRSLMNYTMPGRQGFDDQQAGASRNPPEKFASEPVRAMRRGAGNLTDALVSNDWAELTPGPVLPENRKQTFAKGLEQMTKQAFAAIRGSRFGSEALSMAFDIMVSTGFMRINLGNSEKPLRVRAVPLHEGYPVLGPDGDIENCHRRYVCKAGNAAREYPGAQLTSALAKTAANAPREKVTLVEATYYDPDEAAFRSAWIDPDRKAVMFEYAPEPVSPWITPRLAVAPGCAYGWGFGMDALSVIRVLNKMRESTLKAGAKIAGPPTLFDTRTGLNPHTIRLSANAVGFIDGAALNGADPFYQMPTGDPRWAELSSEQLISLIDDILLATPIVRGMDDLKGVTAYATSIRRQEVLVDRGVDLVRLVSEYPLAVFKRVVWCLSALGQFKGITDQIVVDDRIFSMVPKGPLALAQQSEKVQANLAFIGGLRASLGDQAVTLGIKIEDVASTLASEQPGFPDSLIRDEEERKAMQQQAAQITAARMTQQAPSAAPIDLGAPLA